MALSVSEYAQSGAFDWDVDFVWVQKTSLLKIMDQKPGVVTVLRHDGVELTLSAAQVEDEYFAIRNGQMLKPRYKPRKAHVFSTELTLSENGQQTVYPAGSAILKSEGSFFVVAHDDLMRDYEAVDAPTPETVLEQQVDIS